MGKEEKIIKENKALEKAIRSLSLNIKSLREFVETIEAFLRQKEQQLYRDEAKHLLPFIIAAKEAVPGAFADVSITREEAMKVCGGEIKVEIKDNEPNKKTFSISFPDDDPTNFNDAWKVLTTHSRSYELLYESTLISLLSSIELFFSRVIHFYYSKFPGHIGGKEKVFSYDELTLFGSVEDARSFLVESRVENILREPFDEWVNQLKKMGSISASYLEPHWETLCETWQRRNLIVHNGGIVNGIYLSKVKADKDKPHKKGDQLHVSLKYLKQKFDLFESNCLLLALELWKKLSSGDERRGYTIMDIAFEHLLSKNWSVAESLSRFLSGEKALPETMQLVGKFNYWQAVKRQNRWQDVKEEIENEETESKSSRFRLAWYSLTERKDEFFKELPTALRAKEITHEELITWPIFEDIRSDVRYKKLAKKKSKLPKKISNK